LLNNYRRMHPVRSVISLGQVTGRKVIVGLSAFLNHWNRHMHLGIKKLVWNICNRGYLQLYFFYPSRIWTGSFWQSEIVETPPYRAPHPSSGAFHWDLQPLKIPTPPPGICKSKWFDYKWIILIYWNYFQSSKLLFWSALKSLPQGPLHCWWLGRSFSDHWPDQM